MKNYFFAKNCVLAIAIIFIFNCNLQATEEIEFQKVEPNQVAVKLMELSSVTKTNYDKLKSWEGNIVFESVNIYRGKVAADYLKRNTDTNSTEKPNELMALYKGTIEFKVDLKNDRLFKCLNRPKSVTYTNPDTGVTYESVTGPIKDDIRIVTPEYRIESYPFIKGQDGTIKKRMAVKKSVNPAGLRRLAISDPRENFYFGSPIWVLLSQLSRSIEYKEKGVETFGVILEKGKTAEDNTVYRIQVTDPGLNEQTILTFILKEDIGFNIAYNEAKDNEGSLYSRISIDFAKIEGIFLPTKRVVKQYGDFGLSSEDVRTINTTKINAKIADKTFSLDNCLSNGDKFVDKIAGKRFEYKDGELMELGKGFSPASDSNSLKQAP
jgi:hypothetical protein